jgi:hypothetical protein
MTAYTEVPPHVTDPDVWLRKQALLANIVTGEWLAAQSFPALRYAVPGIVPEGFTILVGAPKLGKSWMVLGVGLAIASGGRALGHLDITEPAPVLYLALEDGHRRLKDRCQTLQLGSLSIPADLQFLTDLKPGTVLETLRAWVEVHGHRSTIIIDTAGRIMPPAIAGESAYARDYRFGAALKGITDDFPGLSLIVVHHTRKAKGADWLEDTSGTNGLPGSADSVLILDRARSSTDGILKVTGRDVVEAEYALTNDNGIWRLQGDGLRAAAARAADIKATGSLGELSATIVRFISDHPEGINAAAVATAINEDPAKVRTYLRRLLEAGRIDQPQRGYYTPVTTVTSVTSKADQPQLLTLVTDVTPLLEAEADELIAAGPQPQMAIINALVGDDHTVNRNTLAHQTIKAKVAAFDWKRCGDYLLLADHRVAADSICVSPSCRRTVGEVLAASQKVLCERCLTKGIEGP